MQDEIQEAQHYSILKTVLKKIVAIAMIFVLLAGIIPAASAAQTGRTNASVHLRERASKSSTSLATLKSGQKVTILKTENGWYKVSYGKYTGYIMKQYVNAGNSSSSTSSTQNSSSSKTTSSSARKQIKALGAAPGTMAPGDNNSDVRKLQKALKILGYFKGTVDSAYGAETQKAVKAYQKANRLQADGVAGKQTVKSIFGSCASTSKTKASAPKKAYKTIVLDWFKDKVTSKIPKNAVFTIKDIRSGRTFQAKRWSGYNHIDAEPKTAKDTATMKSIYGGSWSWARRPILILVNGHVYAASMNGMPHGTSTISKNNFPGHFCIHFKNSKTHGSKKVDPAHQRCVRQASRASW